MTKLIVVLAVVVVIILVVVIVAVRNMRPDDREDYRGAARRQPRRDARGARPPGGQEGGRRQPATADRGFDVHPTQRRGPAERSNFEHSGQRRGGQPRNSQPRSTQPRSSQPRSPERLAEEERAPARARPPRGSRPDSSEWDSSEWEKLSDIDYWAELTSDKPLTTTAQPAAAPSRSAAASPAVTSNVETSGTEIYSRHAASDTTYDRLGPLAGRASSHDLSGPMGPASLPGPVRSTYQDLPPLPRDDDPLTSPSFPTIPGADSRSYRSARNDTPAAGLPAAQQYAGPTQQLPRYDAPAPRPTAADFDRTDPSSYRTEALPRQDSYPSTAGPSSAGARAGNPYGSYVTPDMQPTAQGRYSDYPLTPAGSHSPYLPSAPGPDLKPDVSDYWRPQPPPARSLPDDRMYPDHPRSGYDPQDAAPAGYRNGYGPDDQAGYLPGRYPAPPRDPARYNPLDPYQSDGYGGYSRYGRSSGR